MLSIEKELFEDLMNCMDISEKKLAESLNGGRGETVKNNDLIVFLENVDEFLGVEGDKMGPYIKGDIANIPREIAKILSDGGKVQVIDK